MSRLHTVTLENANETQHQIFDAVKKKLGKVPNLVATMAQSPAAANVYLAGSEALSKGTLSAKFREKLSITIAQANSCDYCLSAHTFIGEKLGIPADQLDAARDGHASDAKEEAGLQFARRVVEQRGHLTEDEFQQVLDAGYTQGEVAEIIASVAINTYTNYFNHLSETEIDFPLVRSADRVTA
jgi:uncharacterized peroxidase-related enzyme